MPECTVRCLDGFLDFCLVDLRLKRKTAVNHKRRVEHVVLACFCTLCAS